MLYRIFNDREAVDYLYWSNTDGWVQAGYDVFTEEEKQRLRLPVDGVWVRAAEGDVATSPNSDPATVLAKVDAEHAEPGEFAGSPNSEIPKWRVRCHLDLVGRGATSAEFEQRVQNLLAEIYGSLDDGDDMLLCERANTFGPITPVLETAE